MIVPGASPQRTAALPRAEVLDTIRRLDWRFLLPDPSLGRVVYLGAAEHDLLTALRAADPNVTTLTDAASGATGVSFDTAVLVDPSPREVMLAAEVLRPGGWLYAEVSSAPGAARRLARQLPQAGFAAVQQHWHWPDFARCTGILPLDDAGALVYGLLKGRGGLRGSVLTLLMRALVLSGALPWLVRSSSVVAQRAAP